MVGIQVCIFKSHFKKEHFTCLDFWQRTPSIEFFIYSFSDSFSVDVLLSSSPVPAKETTYMCQAIDLKDVGVNMEMDYHLVATKGYVDTLELLHHVVIYGCRDDGKSRDLHLKWYITCTFITYYG
jgi:hypothetical protein